MNPKAPARVVIVDDHPIVREGVTALLETDPEFEVCGCAERAEDAYALIRKTSPDVVILDLTLGSDDGIEVARRVLVEEPASKVLVLSMHDELMLADRLFAMGAVGYVTKSGSLGELLDALHTVLRGEMYMSRGLRERRDRRTSHTLPSEKQSPERLLTQRELSVLRLLADGKTATTIASELAVAPKTIYSHRRNIRAKLGLKSGREILRYAVHWSRTP